jgi:hypothetical protein
MSVFYTYLLLFGAVIYSVGGCGLSLSIIIIILNEKAMPELKVIKNNGQMHGNYCIHSCLSTIFYSFEQAPCFWSGAYRCHTEQL